MDRHVAPFMLSSPALHSRAHACLRLCRRLQCDVHACILGNRFVLCCRACKIAHICSIICVVRAAQDEAQVLVPACLRWLQASLGFILSKITCASVACSRVHRNGTHATPSASDESAWRSPCVHACLRAWGCDYPAFVLASPELLSPACSCNLL